jgi:hypothetical protein
MEVFKDTGFQTAAVNVLGQLFQDPQIVSAALELLLTLVEKKETKDALVSLANKASTELLEDREIMDQSRQFIADVMGDDLLQKEGGNALINTVYHALKPGVIR